jgi:branched-subunit amino acid ABC-type transport system permease component
MSTFFLQQLINGLTLGSVYGLIAIGYTMVYGIIGMINFAHGEVYMISAYSAPLAWRCSLLRPAVIPPADTGNAGIHHCGYGGVRLDHRAYCL